MKKLLTILLTSVILSSCEKRNNFEPNVYPQTWELVSMSGSLSNAKPLTASDMPYKEIYILDSDSTFIKRRTQNDAAKTTSGTFTIKKIDNQSYFIFKYSSNNELIGSCSPAVLQEELIIQSNTNISNNSWQACDGPGLTYLRVE